MDFHKDSSVKESEGTCLRLGALMPGRLLLMREDVRQQTNNFIEGTEAWANAAALSIAVRSLFGNFAPDWR
jgi:hypothetical protein